MTHHELGRTLEKATYGGLVVGAVVGLILLVSTLLSGCVPLMAGAAAGAAASGGDIGYYLKTNEVSPTIRDCMKEGGICPS